MRVQGRTALAVALALTALASCSDEQPVRPPPQGVSASVLQYRLDYTVRRVQMKVANDGPTPLVVNAARMISPRFTGEALWNDGPETVPPRTRIDLPAYLTTSRCDVGGNADAGGTPSVRVDYQLPDGATGSLTVPATDPFGVLAKVNAEDCLRSSVEAIAELAVVGPLRTERQRGRLVALLDLRATPTGAAGELRLASIGPTTLLEPARGVRWRLDTTVSAASGPRTLTLATVPTRCDPHAVAEDKLGTVLPVSVSTGERRGVVNVAADTRIKGQVYRYVAAACR